MNLEQIKKLTIQGEAGLSKDKLIENLVPFVWIPNFICPAGSIFYERKDNRQPNDLDIIVRAEEKDGDYYIKLDKSLRLKIDRILQERVKEVSGDWLSTQWVDSIYGPNWRAQTGWDLVLVPHEPQEIIDVNEPQFAEEFYKQNEKRIHRNCINYKDGRCTLKDIEVNPDGPVCDMFEVKVKKVLPSESNIGVLEGPAIKVCANCIYFKDGICTLKNIEVNAEDTACKEFKESILKQSDRDCILTEYNKLHKQGLSDYEIIRKIAANLLPIGFNIDYWEDKVEQVLRNEGFIRKSEGRFEFFKIDKKEYIVGGIVYPCDQEDSQGHQANQVEIWKALKNFMIKGDCIKVMHTGRKRDIPIIESYQAEEDHHKGGMDDAHLIHKGDWWISIYLGDERDIWNDVLKGKLTGFSMAGTASIIEER